MVHCYHLDIQPHHLSLEIPLAAKNRSCTPLLKAYLSLKSAGDMAFFKRDLLPFRERFFTHYNIDPSRVYSLYQEHTQHVVKIIKKNKPEKYHSIAGDGMVTAEKDIYLSITVADCLPVFIVDKETSAYGLVHSGWKGTGIVLKAVRLMIKAFGSRHEHLKLVIGPGIGPCCYNVPEKRYKLFLSKYGQASCRKENGDYFIDLKKANVQLLEESGITDIDIIENCTSCSRALHSFRRDGKDHFGVMMAVTGYFN